MNWQVAAIAISLAALAVSIWSARTSAHTSLEQNRLQTEQNLLQSIVVEIERARERDRVTAVKTAELSAMLFRSGNSAFLRVRNDGHAAASGIQIKVDETPIKESKLVLDANGPLEPLGPGASLDFRFLVFDGMQASYKVDLSWHDASEREGRWWSTLTLP
jgi:hypothetical protein